VADDPEHDGVLVGHQGHMVRDDVLQGDGVTELLRHGPGDLSVVEQGLAVAGESGQGHVQPLGDDERLRVRRPLQLARRERRHGGAEDETGQEQPPISADPPAEHANGIVTGLFHVCPRRSRFQIAAL
jgi:hypothetical protein